MKKTDILPPRSLFLSIVVVGVFCMLLCPVRTQAVKNPAGMVLIPAGFFIPLYSPSDTDSKNLIKPKEIPVTSFYLDALPVTNEDYLEFVKKKPGWQKHKVPLIFTDHSYLKHWKADTETGSMVPGLSPVVNVSWFAAKAYCTWQNKRLPTVSEWEYVAQADELTADASRDPKFLNRILQWYGESGQKVMPKVGSAFRNRYGVYDMHGLIWEWTLDFNTALVTGESRGDSALERSLYCGSGSIGASSFRDYAAFMRYGFRSSLKADYVTSRLGFRCAQSLE